MTRWFEIGIVGFMDASNRPSVLKGLPRADLTIPDLQREDLAEPEIEHGQTGAFSAPGCSCASVIFSLAF
jgi:hypothetical protein